MSMSKYLSIFTSILLCFFLSSCSSLYDAVKFEYPDTIRSLVAKGENIESRFDSGSGFTPLGLSLELRNIDTANLLLELGADPNNPGLNNGDEPVSNFRLVYGRNSKEGFDLLLKYGADLKLHSSADIASIINNLKLPLARDVLELYLKAGVDPNELNHGFSMLTRHPGLYIYPELYTLFIEYGADVNLIDDHNKSPLDIALTTLENPTDWENDKKQLYGDARTNYTIEGYIQFLVENGASINESQKTIIAQYATDPELISFLDDISKFGLDKALIAKQDRSYREAVKKADFELKQQHIKEMNAKKLVSIKDFISSNQKVSTTLNAISEAGASCLSLKKIHTKINAARCEENIYYMGYDKYIRNEDCTQYKKKVLKNVGHQHDEVCRTYDTAAMTFSKTFGENSSIVLDIIENATSKKRNVNTGYEEVPSQINDMLASAKKAFRDEQEGIRAKNAQSLSNVVNSYNPVMSTMNVEMKKLQQLTNTISIPKQQSSSVSSEMSVDFTSLNTQLAEIDNTAISSSIESQLEGRKSDCNDEGGVFSFDPKTLNTNCVKSRKQEEVAVTRNKKSFNSSDNKGPTTSQSGLISGLDTLPPKEPSKKVIGNGEHTIYRINVGECFADSLTTVWKLGSLMGAPTVSGSFKWSGEEGCKLPASTKVWLEVTYGNARGYVLISPVIPEANAGLGYNVTSSPNWNDVLCGFNGTKATSCFDKDRAIYLWQHGTVTSFSVVW